MKKISAILLAIVMLLSMTAMAQTIGTAADGTGSITITNASHGVEYKVYKLFDATLNTTNNSIAYTGEIPDALSAFFTEDSAGNITATEAAGSGENMSAELKAALKTWTATATATAVAESDGSTLEFVGLEYGYYVVTTTQGDQFISVTSTNPNASITDKNSTPPLPEPGEGEEVKSADKTDVNIGDTVTYTITFNTSNYAEDGQITQYIVTDTPAEGSLEDITVTKIMIGDEEYKVNGEVPQFVNNQIVIPWSEGGVSLYPNGAQVVITYTAVVADTAAIDGEGNTNEVVITYETEKGPNDDKLTDSETIYTYAIAIKKVDDKGNPLAGATFELPFYVQETPATDGAYIYAGTTAGEGLTNTLTTPESGLIIIKGVASGKYSITETEAPDGYNKLTDPVKVTAVQTGKTTTNTITYLDEEGNVTEEVTTIEVKVESTTIAATPVVVVNMTGSTLPSTGGIGTTIFYVVGGLMMAAAVVLLVAKKKVAA